MADIIHKIVTTYGLLFIGFMLGFLTGAFLIFSMIF